MFYLTIHSTHFIYGYMGRERNVLFNDTLNTFYLRLYGEREMFYLMTHSTHYFTVIWGERNVLFNDTLNTFFYGYMGRERNVLFNDTLNTFFYGYMGRENCFI